MLEKLSILCDMPRMAIAEARRQSAMASLYFATIIIAVAVDDPRPALLVRMSTEEMPMRNQNANNRTKAARSDGAIVPARTCVSHRGRPNNKIHGDTHVNEMHIINIIDLIQYSCINKYNGTSYASLKANRVSVADCDLPENRVVLVFFGRIKE